MEEVLMSGTRQCRRAAVRLTAAALVIAGCHRSPAAGEATPHGQTSTTPTSSSTSAGASEVAGRAAVEGAYQRFWTVSWRIDGQPPERWRSVLAAVATEPVLTRLVERTGLQVRDGITRYGRVIPHVTAVSIDAAGRATVRDCQDAHAAGQADRRTGGRKTVGVARSPVVGTLVRGSDGLWRVADIRYIGGGC
jgi:hypothetical protein